MSIKAIAPKMSSSFVYEGCYRPRGGLTFAERSAWGLRAPSRRLPVSKAIAPALVPQAQIFRPLLVARSRSNGGTTSGPLPRLYAGRNEKPRFRAGCMSPSILRIVKRFATLYVKTQSKNLERWYRLSVKVGDDKVTCLIVGRRAFVAAGISSNARPT
jgi:hypothetical protein